MSSVSCPTLGLVRNWKYCNAGAAYLLLMGTLWPETEFTQARTNQSRKWCWFVCWSWIWGSEREKLLKMQAARELMKRPAGFLGTHSTSHVQELSRTLQTAPASFHVVCKTFLEAWQELSFQGRVKAGYFHQGSTFREGQSVARVSEPQTAGCRSHSCHTTAFLPQRPVQHQQWQWDGEGGNAGLDLLPVTVLIYSWLFLNQFLAVVHGADIAFLLLPSKRSWKKCLLLVFSLYVQKLYPKQEQLSPDNVTG